MPESINDSQDQTDGLRDIRTLEFAKTCVIPGLCPPVHRLLREPVTQRTDYSSEEALSIRKECRVNTVKIA